MTLIEAIKTGKPFKRKGWKSDCWVTIVDGDYFVCDEFDNVLLTVKDVLANDWIVKEKWYEGNFKEKYPNGVLCLVSNNKKDWFLAIVNNYNKNSEYPFVEDINNYKFAKPITEDKMPFILKEGGA